MHILLLGVVYLIHVVLSIKATHALKLKRFGGHVTIRGGATMCKQWRIPEEVGHASSIM